MKRKWAMLLSLLLLLAAGAAERTSSLYAARLAERRHALATKLAEASDRTLKVNQEKAEYEAIEALARKVAEQIQWEPDSTNVLRWFAETAADTGVRVVNSKVLPPDKKTGTVAGGAFNRAQFALHLEGAYAPLVRYVERVERSPSPMLIEFR